MGRFHTIYFSATDTTRCCVTSFCRGYGAKPDTSINLADDFKVNFPAFTPEDVVVVASPVYGGRLPVQVANALVRLHGNNAIVIALVVYGNRDYDDALLELTDTLHNNNFRIAGVGVFIGQHSLFPKVATSRPDISDEQKLIEFGCECKATVSKGFDSDIVPFIKGKRPYKKAAGAPFYPKAKKNDCVKCGKCADNCPVDAISVDTPYITDTTKCISCGRCITICPKGVRHYSGIAYSLVGAIFKAAFSKRKEPEYYLSGLPSGSKSPRSKVCRSTLEPISFTDNLSAGCKP